MAGWFHMANPANIMPVVDLVLDDDDPLSIMQPGSAFKPHYGLFVRQNPRGSGQRTVILSC